MAGRAIFPRLSNYIVDEWNATDQPIQQRGGVLPLGIYEDGSAHLAWPGMITDTLDAFDRAGQGPGMQNPEDALIIGGSLGVGGLAAPRPRNALASNSVRQEAPAAVNALDMSTEARLARAMDMGFDADNIVYHGTASLFDEFDPLSKGATMQTHQLKDFPQIHTTTSRQEAETYGPTVLELYLRGKYKDIDNPLTMQENILDRLTRLDNDIRMDDELWNRSLIKGNDYTPKFSDETGKVLREYLRGAEQTKNYNDLIAHKLMRRELSRARREGFDGVKIMGGWGDDYAGDHYVVIDPRNIRSIHAAFDPAKADSANLLAANPWTSAPLGLAPNAFEDDYPTYGVRPLPREGK